MTGPEQTDSTLMPLAQSGTLAADSLAPFVVLGQRVITLPPTGAGAPAIKAALRHLWSEIRLRQLRGRQLSSTIAEGKPD